MGRKAIQRKNRNQAKSSASNIEDLLLTPNCFENSIENRYSPDSLRNLRKELKEAITSIYAKYVLRFRQIKEIRIGLQDPALQVSTEELVIEKNYCNELTQKVKQLVHLDSLNDIYYTFCKSVINFMLQIHTEMQELKNSDPLLQLACLAEAYFVVENSARELSKVTSGIFDQQSSYITCESVTKLAFLDKVVKFYNDLIKSAGTTEHETVNKVADIEKELKILAENITGLDKKSKSSKNKNFLAPPTSNLTVDEIVNYINGSSRDGEKKGNRRRRVSKASTADTSRSPLRQRSIEIMWTSLEEECKNTALDKEIEQFQCILESTKPLGQKLKPSLSEEWLRKIRSQILKHN